MLASVLLSFLAAASGVLSAPSLKTSQCDVSRVAMNLPSSTQTGSTPLASPLASGPKFIGVAIGVQNYTCASTGTYTSVGAVAEIFDVSCVPPAIFNIVTDIALQAWKAAPAKVTAQDVVKGLAQLKSSAVLGQHYFITNPITGSGLSPKWDFTSASKKGDANAFVVGAKTGDVVAPTNPTANVDWLSLKSAQGELADQVFRIETRDGQPPATCTPGSKDISVKYASQYWFFGGSF